jgi:metal-responsive CopG/Arc/MetJ family transcriptional regulator
MIEYEPAMRPKIAVSLPQKTFATLERKRRELKKSRSALVAEALEAWFAGGTLSDEERRYVAGYVKHPETEADAAAFTAASVWGEWDET